MGQEFAPDHPEALWNLGKIELAAGRLEEAARLLLRATEIRRSAPDGWELLTRLALERRIFPERAEEFAHRALLLRPSARNHERLAQARFLRGDRDGAIAAIRQGLERHPTDEGLRAGLEALAGAAGASRRGNGR